MIIDTRLDSYMESGTRMIFQQTNAPLGWMKDTSPSINNRMLRIVSSSAFTSGGGSNGFTNVMNSTVTTTGGGVHFHALSINEMPWHNHGSHNHVDANPGVVRYLSWRRNGHSVHYTTGDGSNVFYHSNNSDWLYQGSSWGHSHGFTNPNFNLNLKYIDFIVCTKT